MRRTGLTLYSRPGRDAPSPPHTPAVATAGVAWPGWHGRANAGHGGPRRTATFHGVAWAECMAAKAGGVTASDEHGRGRRHRPA